MVVDTEGRDRERPGGDSRRRRDRDNIQDLLLDAAIIEFGQKGYDGAPTTSIAKRADAHQPQINYHFSSKEELWYAAVDRLFKRFDEHLADVDFDGDPLNAFALYIRRIVEYMHDQPELNQIMIQLGTADSERLRWVTDKHVKHRYEGLKAAWIDLQSRGVAAPIDPRLVHWVLIGGAGLAFARAQEVSLFIEGGSFSDELIEAHIAGLIDTLLPGLPERAGVQPANP